MLMSCLTLVSLQDLDEDTSLDSDTSSWSNNEWKQELQRYRQEMQSKEKDVVRLSQQDLKQVQNLGAAHRRSVQKIIQRSQHQQHSRLTSFLEVNSPIPDQDDPKLFFGEDVSFTTNINSIPYIGNVTISGWSSSYWPMRNGEVSVRYPLNDKNTIGVVDPESGEYSYLYTWSESVFRYAQPQEHDSMFKTNYTNYAKYVDDNYSPSEKYDLLLGDYQFTLTNYLKNEGYSHSFGGDIPTWYGLCHGWAIASVYFPRPFTSLTLTNPDGIPIRFLPDDIKGLAVLFWGNAQSTTKFMGKICEHYWPDPGWFSSAACRSLNPASFMIVLGNQCGLWGKNLVYDPDADPEIWNFPLKSYEFKYYNPLNNEFFNDASSAKVNMSALLNSGDEFLSSLSSTVNATSALGVFMRVTKTQVTDITKLHHNDTTADDEDTTDEFDAVITLDSSDNIIGGEWKFKTHPNFLWFYDEKDGVKGVNDETITEFSTDKSYLDSIMDKIRDSSSRGQPLLAVVNYLVNNSS